MTWLKSQITKERQSWDRDFQRIAMRTATTQKKTGRFDYLKKKIRIPWNFCMPQVQPIKSNQIIIKIRINSHRKVSYGHTQVIPQR